MTVLLGAESNEDHLSRDGEQSGDSGGGDEMSAIAESVGCKGDWTAKDGCCGICAVSWTEHWTEPNAVDQRLREAGEEMRERFHRLSIVCHHARGHGHRELVWDKCQDADCAADRAVVARWREAVK